MAILTREAVEDFVLDALAKFGTDRSEITAEVAFDDIGVDSIDVTELGQAVRREFGIELRPRDFEDALHVGEALDVMYEKAGL